MIEIGEYIRTKDGYIGKYLSYEEDGEKFEIFEDSDWKWIIFQEDIKTHSKNIIDLIEVGDYVNGYLVGGISDNGETAEKEIMIEIPYEKTYNKHILNEEIKTILTHEQYEQNCYKL